MATALEISKLFQCHICKNLFKDPVTIDCGHSFCQHCLDRHMSMHVHKCPLCEEAVCTKPRVNATFETLLQEFLQTDLPELDLYTGRQGEIPCTVCGIDLTFKAVKSCLTCLHSYCEWHLKRHRFSGGLRHHKLVSPMENLEEKACREHGRPLELFSRSSKRLICILCVRPGEDFIPVEKERERIEAEQMQTIENLEKTIHRNEVNLEDLQNTVTLHGTQIDRDKNLIKEVFAKAMNDVREAEEEMLNSLEDGRRCLEKERTEKTQQIQSENLKYKEIISRLNKTQKEEDDIIFVKSYPSVPAESIQDRKVSVDTYLRIGSMRNMISAILASVRTKLENLFYFDIRRIQKFAVDVTMDEGTAHPSLEVYQDCKSVKFRGDVHSIQCSPQKFDLVVGILGKFQIMSRRAFWVVKVGQDTTWELGVVRENANRRGEISYKPNEGYWVVKLCSSNLYCAFEDPPIHLRLSTKPQKVGVFVDFEEAIVSFYDMDNKSHMYTFTGCRFNEKIRPYFNPCPNKDGKNSHPMTICSVNPSEI